MTIAGASEKITGLFFDKGGAIFNIKHPDFGAVGDGVTDDTAAINACYAAIPDGGTMLIPVGAFRFTSKLSFNRSVNIFGLGPGSALVPDLSSTSVDGVVINDTSSALLYRVRLDNFAILSNNTNSCRDSFVCNRLNVSEVNVHVKAKATRYGTRLNGCLLSRFRIVSSVNFTYPYSAGMSALDSLRIQKDTVNGYGCNGNDIEVRIEGGYNGVWIEDQTSQGNMRISGVVEGATATGATRGLYAKGCLGLDIEAFHCESNNGGIEFDTCISSQIDGGTQCIPSGAAGTITITNSTNIFLGTVYCDSLSVDTLSRRVHTGGGFLYGASGGVITDPSHMVLQRTGTLEGVTASTPSGTPVTLLDMSLRGGGRYTVTAYIRNGGVAYMAIADFVYDGTNAARVTGTNASLMTTTLAGSSSIQATQSSGTNQAVAFSILFTPAPS